MRRLLMVGVLIAAAFVGAQGVAQAQVVPSVAYDQTRTLSITAVTDPSAGSSVQACGEHWPLGAVITVTLSTSPQTVLGTLTVGAGGSFCQSFHVLCGVESASETATASGPTVPGMLTASTQVTIVTCPPQTEVAGVSVERPVTVAGVSVTNRGQLPFTGSDQTNLYVGVGAALLLAGTALLIATARRRRSGIEIDA